MYNRLKDFPTYETREGEVSANHFNHVTIALKHLHTDELRYRIPELWHLDLILQHDAWIIVDSALNDAPVAAWVDFSSEHRENLHEEVACRINFYHIHAPVVMGRTLEAMEMMLGEALADELPEDKADIVPFNKK